jgi:hypothetical protein
LSLKAVAAALLAFGAATSPSWSCLDNIGNIVDVDTFSAGAPASFAFYFLDILPLEKQAKSFLLQIRAILD